MERKMYLANRKMSKEAAEALLINSKIASLAVNGDAGYPYVIPIYYIYEDGAIYFHSAKYGYKLDAISRDARVCLNVIGETEVINEKFTATFDSVVVNGIAEYVEDDATREQILKEMIVRWTGGLDDSGVKKIDNTIGKAAVIRVNITELTGKAYHG